MGFKKCTDRIKQSVRAFPYVFRANITGCHTGHPLLHLAGESYFIRFPIFYAFFATIIAQTDVFIKLSFDCRKIANNLYHC